MLKKIAILCVGATLLILSGCDSGNNVFTKRDTKEPQQLALLSIDFAGKEVK